MDRQTKGHSGFSRRGAPRGVLQRFHDTILGSTSAPSTFYHTMIGGGSDKLSTTGSQDE